MASRMERDETGATELIALRTDGGAWYELPAAALEQVRVTDPDQLAAVRGRLAADTAGDDASPAVLAAERLAPHRVDDERASVLEAAGEVAGFEWDRRGYFVYTLTLIDIAPGINGPYDGQSNGGQRGGTVSSWQITTGYLFESTPSSRFGGGTPYVR
jgi:hypothetical protein